MKSINRWTGDGTLVRDPEVRFLADGTAMAKARIACNKADKKIADGQWEKQPSDFFDVVFWKYQAKKAATLAKGDRIAVTDSHLSYRTWEKDGVKHSKVEIVVDDFVRCAFIDTRENKDNTAPENTDTYVPADHDSTDIPVDEDVPF